MWPDILKTKNPTEIKMAKAIIPIHCDQKYGVQEMNKIVEALLHG